jgi:hypothetical protein
MMQLLDKFQLDYNNAKSQICLPKNNLHLLNTNSLL